jgi:adenosylhomocysteinase
LETAIRAAADQRFAILEIGGYFAPILSGLRAALGDRFLGVVEDTEAGHRRYEAVQPLPCPVVSVARSPLKEGEDSLVGASCVFSVEKLLRSLLLIFDGFRNLVLGYGKVGRGLSRTLKPRGCSVAVFDIDPVRQILALAEGMTIPDREFALKNADVIWGCAGTQSIGCKDFASMRDGTVLVSCSSKQIEFDVKALKSDYEERKVTDEIACYQRGTQRLYLVHQGKPVNFLDNGVIGPVLALIQAEIILGLQHVVAKHRHTGDLLVVETSIRRTLAERWLQIFRNPERGGYKIQKSDQR